jgi:hypothetical protein
MITVAWKSEDGRVIYAVVIGLIPHEEVLKRVTEFPE